MSLVGLRKRGVLADGESCLANKLLEERIHGLEAVWIPDVVSKEHIVIEEKDVVFSAVQKDEAVLQ